MKNWFEIKALAGAAPEISIFDEIGGYGISAKTFIAALQALNAPAITLNINSPGGSVFDSLAIYNALKSHSASITARILGVAASAASVVAMAGDHIVMPDNSFMMVHQPFAGTIGNAENLREMADVLDKIGNSLVSIYVRRSGQSEDKVRELLAAETWLNAQDALALGFADEIEPAVKMAASFDLDRLPDGIRAAVQPPAAPVTATPPAAPSMVATITTLAGKYGLADFTRVFLLDESIKNAEQATAALEEAREVRELCIFARVPEMVAELISNRISLRETRIRIQNHRAELDEALQTDSHIPSSSASGLSAQIWSARNGSR